MPQKPLLFFRRKKVQGYNIYPKDKHQRRYIYIFKCLHKIYFIENNSVNCFFEGKKCRDIVNTQKLNTNAVIYIFECVHKIYFIENNSVCSGSLTAFRINPRVFERECTRTI